jgi:hypothetical protein
MTAARSLSSEEQLLALLVYSQLKQMDCAETSIAVSGEQLEQLKQEAAAALQRAQEAQEDSGFWGAIADFLGSDIGQVAAVVAAAAAVVATAGAGSAIVAAVAAAVSIAAQRAEELGIPPEVAMVIAIVAAVASLCVGNGAGLFDIGNAVKTTAANVHTAATVAQGAATVGAGGATVAKGKYDGDVQHARADARSANGRTELEKSQIDEATQRLAAALDQHLRVLEQGSQMIQHENNATTMVLCTMGGAA